MHFVTRPNLDQPSTFDTLERGLDPENKKAERAFGYFGCSTAAFL